MRRLEHTVNATPLAARLVGGRRYAARQKRSPRRCVRTGRVRRCVRPCPVSPLAVGVTTGAVGPGAHAVAVLNFVGRGGKARWRYVPDVRRCRTKRSKMTRCWFTSRQERKVSQFLSNLRVRTVRPGAFAVDSTCTQSFGVSTVRRWNTPRSS